MWWSILCGYDLTCILCFSRPPIQFHNWTCKLVDRLRKYQQRGIEVVGAPIIGEEDQMRKLSVTQHGG